jgi:hypothetical protein
MSDPTMWRDRCDFIKRTQVGIDPFTRRPSFDNVLVLQNEPCDLFNKARRVAEQSTAGTVYNTVQEPTLKIMPADFSKVPDENDEISVNGTRYKVVSRQDFFDGGSAGALYRGSRLTLHLTQAVR